MDDGPSKKSGGKNQSAAIPVDQIGDCQAAVCKATFVCRRISMNI